MSSVLLIIDVGWLSQKDIEFILLVAPVGFAKYHRCWCGEVINCIWRDRFSVVIAKVNIMKNGEVEKVGRKRISFQIDEKNEHNGIAAQEKLPKQRFINKFVSDESIEGMWIIICSGHERIPELDFWCIASYHWKCEITKKTLYQYRFFDRQEVSH